MKAKLSLGCLVRSTLVLTAVTWMGCNSTGNAAVPSAEGSKIPVTTKSEDARKEFLQGQALADKLQLQDSIAHFDKAVALDPDFASAELALANASPTAHEFFDHLKKAVSLADKTSEGERLLILATQAGANRDTATQKQDLDKLLAEFPNDERVQLTVGAVDFGQQDFKAAIEHLKKATEVAPNFSASYNMLGYSYRQTGDYTGAEQAFKKYIELIPNDPNPYDSYGELLLKMGRFDDSIAQYRKALAIDPDFLPSHFGMSADFMYLGKPADATAELQQMIDRARSDGDRRTALFGMSVVAADSGNLVEAARQMDREYAVAEKTNDHAAMSADLQAKGNILLQAKKYDDAKQQFERSVKLVDESTLSQEIKDNAHLIHHYNMGAVAAGKNDFKSAQAEAEEFSKGAEASKNPILIWQAHQLAGIIALGQKNYDQAITELQQANQQDPQNLYRIAEAYSGKHDSAKAQEFSARAAEFNSLPQLNYAFIRSQAQKLAKKS